LAWPLATTLLYDSYMTEMAVSAAREHLAELIETTGRTSEPVYVTRRGRRVAVILHPDVYERLIEDAEDAIDRAELRAAREDADYVPWEEVKSDLGLA
jgi:antitoxin Phd